MHIDINTLLSLPIWQMTGAQFVALAQYANASAEAQVPVAPPQAIGIAELADALHCSVAQVAVMRRDGVLDEAIVSRIGRHIVFDIDKARKAANEWKMNQKK